MLKYIAKRLLAMIPVILGVTLIVYLIMSLAPGDPARTILGEQATEEQVQELRTEMERIAGRLMEIYNGRGE